MRVGVSLSPGGLLLPYHVGVLDGLKHCGYIVSADSAVAGASAGAIAAAAHACGVDSSKVLDATVDISERTRSMGGARGRLLPLLREKLHEFIDEDRFLESFVEGKEGKNLAVAYREIFPKFRAVHQTDFEDRHDLIDSVCASSMFPFFSTNWPVSFDRREGRALPRVVVDGFFAVPRTRFGCPDFDLADGIDDLEETVMVSVFPRELIGLEVPDDGKHFCVSPDPEDAKQLERLLRLATESSSRKELYGVYESGFDDAERWHKEHAARKRETTTQRQKQQQQQQQQRDGLVGDGTTLELN
jgi:hypothetical protein